MSLFLQTPWEEIGRLKLEALREELHCFDSSNTTSFGGSFHALCCTAAMQIIQAGKTGDEYGARTDLSYRDRRKNARVTSGRRAVLQTEGVRGQRATAARATLRMSARSMPRSCNSRLDMLPSSLTV